MPESKKVVKKTKEAEEKQPIKVVKKTELTTEQKETVKEFDNDNPEDRTTKVTVDDVTKQLSTIDGVTTKENKSGWTTVKDTKNRAYIKNSKYGVAVWSIKANKTLPIKTNEDVTGFVNSIKSHTKKE